ncbi:DUF2637 domain-containing protein [Glycomyces tenuis]|uniref:DUF2637 domain-containing protein n=1 Tax=Glycomyces tenuis TaxID=58116 RepID=UPI0003FC8F4B|nr:DUF2637 domain-containing protein [Glycomyces tenuis]
MDATTVQAPPGQRQPHEAESKAAAKVTRRTGAAEARIAERDAESARRLRERESAIELRHREAEIERIEREAKAADREAKRARRAERRRARRQARTERARAAATRVYVFVAGNAPAVYSSGIYAMALYVAVYGQISMATERGWPIIFGIGMAVFLEGLALSMALTAHQLRLKGERALVPAAMTWIAAGFASAINFVAHRDDLVMASVLGASSLAAIIVWEVRSGAKHRDALRKLGLIPDPPERFGVRRWIRYPRSTWRAWSLDVRDRVGSGAARLLARTEVAAMRSSAMASAKAAQAALESALDSAQLAAWEAERAQAAAANAVKAAKRPVRRFRLSFRRKPAEPPPAAKPRPASKPAPAIESAPKARPSKQAPAKPSPAKPRPSGDFTAVEEAIVQLWSDTGKRPGARAIEAAVSGVRKKSAIHSWMQSNPERVDELSARAEAIRAGREVSS